MEREYRQEDEEERAAGGRAIPLEGGEGAEGGADQRTLGKRVETATSLIFGESISDNNIASKYRERLDSKSESPGVPSSVSVYWEGEDLTRLAHTIWRTLKLPMRGETKTLPFVK